MTIQPVFYREDDRNKNFNIPSSAHYDESINILSVPQKEERSIKPYQYQQNSPLYVSYKSKSSSSILSQESSKYKITKPFLSRNQRDTTSKFRKDIDQLSRRLKTNMTLVTYNLMFDLSQSSRPDDVYVYEQIKCQNTFFNTVTTATNLVEEERNREVKNEIKLSADYDEDLFAIDSSLDEALDDLLLGFTNNSSIYHTNNNNQQISAHATDSKFSVI